MTFISGFYGVTYCLGFRDDFEVKVRRLRTEVTTHLTRTHNFSEGRRSHPTDLRTRNELESGWVPEDCASYQGYKRERCRDDSEWQCAPLSTGVNKRPKNCRQRSCLELFCTNKSASDTICAPYIRLNSNSVVTSWMTNVYAPRWNVHI